jgi:hypothetical protein
VWRRRRRAEGTGEDPNLYLAESREKERQGKAIIISRCGAMYIARNHAPGTPGDGYGHHLAKRDLLADLLCLLECSPPSLDVSLNDIAPGVDARDGPPGMGVDWLDEAVVDGEPGGSFGLAAIVELICNLPVSLDLVSFPLLVSAVLRVCALPGRSLLLCAAYQSVWEAISRSGRELSCPPPPVLAPHFPSQEQ